MSAAAGEQRVENTSPAQTRVLVLGYKGHDTITDTDIQRGDWFVINDVEYEITMLTPVLATMVQAVAVARE